MNRDENVKNASVWTNDAQFSVFRLEGDFAAEDGLGNGAVRTVEFLEPGLGDLADGIGHGVGVVGQDPDGSAQFLEADLDLVRLLAWEQSDLAGGLEATLPVGGVGRVGERQSASRLTPNRGSRGWSRGRSVARHCDTWTMMVSKIESDCCLVGANVCAAGRVASSHTGGPLAYRRDR